MFKRVKEPETQNKKQNSTYDSDCDKGLSANHATSSCEKLLGKPQQFQYL
jgi:hypothetical protein